MIKTNSTQARFPYVITGGSIITKLIVSVPRYSFYQYCSNACQLQVLTSCLTVLHRGEFCF